MKLSTDKMMAEKADGIGWMTFNNPERHNALSVEMRHGILEIIADFAADDEVRVVVMTGAGGKSFVSGADISQFEQQRASPEQQVEYAALSGRVEDALLGLEKPLIAMIRGYCLGGGLGIALQADIRVASDDSRFGIPAARLSIGYPYKGLKRLMDLVGPSRTKEILFTATRYSAQEAYEMGLVNKIVPAGALKDTVTEMATTMVNNAPLTLKATKLIIGEAVKDAADRDIALCEAVVKACMESDDYVEGRRAFMEKRKARFTGR
jgi:enoyl-CoA hydratase/carnithine racemase